MENTLGAEEQALLRRICELGGTTVGDLVCPMREQRGWGRSTVQRMIDRLLKKGWLVRESVDGVYVYRASRSSEEIDAEVLRQFVKTRFEGRVSPLVAFLDGGVNLKQEEVDRLKAIVDQWEAES